MKKFEVKRRGRPVISNVFTAVLCGTGLILLGAVVITALICGGVLDETSIKAPSMAVLALSFCISVILAAREQDGAALRITASVAIVYVVLLIMNFAVADGDFSGLGSGTLMAVLGVCIGISIKIIRWKAPAKGKYKYHFR